MNYKFLIDYLARLHITIANLPAGDPAKLALKPEFKKKKKALFDLAKSIRLTRRNVLSQLRQTAKNLSLSIEKEGRNPEENERKPGGNESFSEQFREIEFYDIPPGSYVMNRDGLIVNVQLSHSIQVMATKVTQKQWADIMEENPSHFADGADSIPVTINGKSVTVQPDHPVEQITWWSAIVFANKLSQKMD